MIWISLSLAQPSKDWFNSHPLYNMEVSSTLMNSHSMEFSQSIGSELRADLIDRLTQSESKIKDRCTEHYNFISFEHLERPDQTPEDLLFLNNLFGIEQLHCIENTSIESVLASYRSAEFRKQAMPGVVGFSSELVRLNEKGDDFIQSCTQTKSGFGVLATSYCMLEREHKINSTIWIHSVLRSTETKPSYQQLLFREEALFVKTYNSGVALYRYTITRGQDLGKTGKYFLEKTLFYTHGSIKEALQTE